MRSAILTLIIMVLNSRISRTGTVVIVRDLLGKKIWCTVNSTSNVGDLKAQLSMSPTMAILFADTGNILLQDDKKLSKLGIFSKAQLHIIESVELAALKVLREKHLVYDYVNEDDGSEHLLINFTKPVLKSLLNSEYTMDSFRQVIHLLVAAGFDLNALPMQIQSMPRIWNHSLLYFAVSEGNLDAVRILVSELKVNMNPEDIKKHLFVCADNHRNGFEIAQFLIEHGADVNATNAMQLSVLKYVENLIHFFQSGFISTPTNKTMHLKKMETLLEYFGAY